MASAESLADQTEVVQCCLTLLREECNPQQYQDAVNILLKIIRNVISNPTEVKYKELKTSNKTFTEKVWRFAGAQQFLIATGWAEVDDKVLLIDDQYLSMSVTVLEQVSRESGQANTAAGVTQRPVESKSGSSQSQKDKKLDEIRRKQMEQMQKEKQERQRIAEMIKADRQETSTRKSKDSVARVRQYGANINRFGDIGVDLNGGGG